MAIRRSSHTLKTYIRFLQSENREFTVDISHKTYTVKYKNQTRTFSDNMLPIEGLNLVRSVRSYVKNNNIGANFPVQTASQLRIQYICFDKRNLSKNIVGIKEVDMNRAYWETAFMKGVINQEIYDRGVELTKDGTRESKISRLVALGTLAKEVKQRKFNGVTYEKPTIIEDSAATRHLWDHICAGVDTVMKNCMQRLRDDFSFFWTDAIFFVPNGDNEQRIKDAIKQYGYDSKTIENEWYEFRSDACYVFSKTKGRFINDRQYKKIDLKWVVANVDLKKAFDLPDGVKTPTGKKLKSMIQDKLKVRNFCYAITNEDIWKNRKINKQD